MSITGKETNKQDSRMRKRSMSGWIKIDGYERLWKPHDNSTELTAMPWIAPVLPENEPSGTRKTLTECGPL
jgi:hypothetical protein